MKKEHERILEGIGLTALILAAYGLISAHFPPYVRHQVRKEQSHRCADPECCDPNPNLELHHRVPQSMNGNDNRANAVALCPTHHAKWDKLALEEKVIFPGIPLSEAPKALFRRKRS